MTPLAIVFMLLAMAIIWGGLVVSVIFLVRNPLEDDGDDDEPSATSRGSHP